MKFLCDSCGTKYSIADERVRGRVLKIRCKKCDFVITVREDVAAAAAVVEAPAAASVVEAPAAAPFEEEQTAIGALDQISAPAAPEADDWFISFDGEQEGPYSLGKAKERVAAEKHSGKEAHAWRPGFLVWLPIEEVPELAVRVAKPPPLRARALTPVANHPVAAIKKDPSGPRAALSVSAGNKPLAKPVVHAAPPPIPAVPQAVGLFAQTAPSPAPDIQSMFPAGAPQDDDVEDDSSGGADAPDLPISNEASGLVNLAHLAQAAMGQKPAGPVFMNGHTARQPVQRAAPISALELPELPELRSSGGPVVVVSGAAQAGSSPLFKYIALAAIPLLLGLGGAVVYLLMHPPATIIVTEPSRHRDDSPITINDPGVPIAGQVDPKRPGGKHSGVAGKGPAQTGVAQSGTAKAGDGLSGSQRSLADLYKEDGDKVTPHALTGSSHGEQQGGQVSQSAIIAAVNANKRQLTLCYERALKHDNSMKSGRVPIQVTVGMSGRVTKVAISDPQYASSELGECFVQAVKRWSFPSSDAEYSTEFPFILQGQ